MPGECVWVHKKIPFVPITSEAVASVPFPVITSCLRLAAHHRLIITNSSLPSFRDPKNNLSVGREGLRGWPVINGESAHFGIVPLLPRINQVQLYFDFILHY